MMKPDPVGAHNEQMKALGTVMTGLSLIVMTYGVFRPAMEDGGVNFKNASPWWLLVGLLGIVGQQLVLRQIKKGD